MAEKDNSVHAETVAMNRLLDLLPNMPPIEGQKVQTLADVKKLDRVQVNLVLAYFSDVRFAKLLLDMYEDFEHEDFVIF